MAEGFVGATIRPWDRADGNTTVCHKTTCEIIAIPPDSTPAGWICGRFDGASYDLLPNNIEYSV
jgi:hypothetical protein